MASEWKECTLAELGEIVGGATPSTKDESNYGGDIAWITPKDLSTLRGRFIAHGERNITEKGLNSCSTQMMPANAVLFSSRAPIGYVAIAKNPVCTNQGFKNIVANEDSDPMFLYYLLKYNKDAIEAMGVERSKEAIEHADLVLFVCDGSQPLTDEDRLIMELCTEHAHAIALINKSDLGAKVVPSDLPFMNVIEISASTGVGLDLLADTVDVMFANDIPCDGSILTNARQYDACRRAHEAILRALQGLRLQQTPDLVLIDVEAAMEAMGEVTGATVREDITARIFERFCVGK